MLESLAEAEASFNEIAARLGEPFSSEYREFCAARRRRREEMEAKVRWCHPDGVHWPPHDECPACQAVYQNYDRLARRRCAEEQAEPTDDNLIAALREILDERAKARL